MSSSKLIFGLICFLSSITFLAQKVSSLNYLSHICSNSEFIPNSPYEKNLDDLLVDLKLNSPATGFLTRSTGIKPDRAHGLALCRGGLSINQCKSCLFAASQEIVRLCPRDKEAIIWYDDCFLKYSDDCFRGEIDSKYKYSLASAVTPPNPEYFNALTKEMLVCLAEKASRVENFYAFKKVQFGDIKLYGLVQCTRDLSKEDCNKCLDEIINNELRKCCAGKEGGRVLTGSCNARFEIYPFYTNNAASWM